MKKLRLKYVTASLCIFSLFFCYVLEAKQQWKEATDVNLKGWHLTPHRNMLFEDASGKPGPHKIEIGDMDLVGPPLEKGDVTFTGQLEEKNGTVIWKVKDESVIWNKEVRAFQFDFENWRVQIWRLPGSENRLIYKIYYNGP